jgi:peptidoglycan/LPS O-acetylase OafA/YrhL
MVASNSIKKPTLSGHEDKVTVSLIEVPKFGEGNKRIASLDGIRAMAAMLVVFVHAFPKTLPGGWVGVDVFFVLSGYIITNQIQHELKKNNGKFEYIYFIYKRLIRLYPALIAAILIYIAFVYITDLPFRHYRAAFISSVYMMDVNRAFQISTGGFLGHTWTLGIEFKYYLIVPLIFSFLYRTRTAISITIGLVALVVVWRLLLLQNGADSVRLAEAFDTRLDQLFIGSLVAIAGLERFRAARLLLPLSLAFLTYIVFTASKDNAWIISFGFTLIGISVVPLLVCALIGGWFSQIMSLQPLPFLGKISYSIYIWHVILFEAFVSLNVPYREIFMLILIIPVAWLSWALFEVRFDRFKSREVFNKIMPKRFELQNRAVS